MPLMPCSLQLMRSSQQRCVSRRRGVRTCQLQTRVAGRGGRHGGAWRASGGRRAVAFAQGIQTDKSLIRNQLTVVKLKVLSSAQMHAPAGRRGAERKAGQPRPAPARPGLQTHRTRDSPRSHRASPGTAPPTTAPRHLHREKPARRRERRGGRACVRQAPPRSGHVCHSSLVMNCWFQCASSSELCFDSVKIIHVPAPPPARACAHAPPPSALSPCRTCYREKLPEALCREWFKSPDCSKVMKVLNPERATRMVGPRCMSMRV